LPLPGEPAKGHAWVQQASGSYLIRVADSKAVRYLRIGPARPASSKSQGGDAVQAIDLAGFVIL
jgi:hypothetical protein